MADLDDLRDEFRRFRDERGWAQFHDPKSLILALVGEVGELAELFQWLPADQATERATADPLRARAAEEMADVLIYLVGLADELEINLIAAAREKLKGAEHRFPAGEYAGRAPEKS